MLDYLLFVMVVTNYRKASAVSSAVSTVSNKVCHECVKLSLQFDVLVPSPIGHQQTFETS